MCHHTDPGAGQAPTGELTHFRATLTASQEALGAQQSAALRYCYKSTNRLLIINANQYIKFTSYFRHVSSCELFQPNINTIIRE